MRRFQARHGIIETGVVNQQTLDALNVPAETRLRQLETNLVRLRSFSRDLGNRYVTANIPAAQVETVENGQVVTHHIAGVGKIDRQSPVMQTKAYQVNFNPFWTVPASVIRKDLIPKMQADPNYLHDNHIRVYNKDGQELQPEQINWRSLDAMNYKFRQDIGGDFNSLGVCASTSPILTASICTTRRPRASSATISASSPRAASACRMCATMSPGCCGDAGLGPRRRSTAPSRSGERIDVKINPAGAGLLGLYHRLGHARRDHPVPRGHLSARRADRARAGRRSPAADAGRAPRAARAPRSRAPRRRATISSRAPPALDVALSAMRRRSRRPSPSCPQVAARVAVRARPATFRSACISCWSSARCSGSPMAS